MTSLVMPVGGGMLGGAVIRAVAETVKADVFSGHGGYSIEKLPTDAIGATNVTFSGVPAGSEIRVQYPDTTDAAGIESCAADQVLSWDVFAPGSPNNTVRIVIIDMTHRIKEFTYTSALGNQSIPIQSENDKWYSNP